MTRRDTPSREHVPRNNGTRGCSRLPVAAAALLALVGLATAVAHAAPRLLFDIPAGFVEMRGKPSSWIDNAKGWTIRHGWLPLDASTSADALYTADMAGSRHEGEIRVLRVPGAVGAYMLTRRARPMPRVVRVFTRASSHEILLSSRTGADPEGFQRMQETFLGSLHVAP